MEVVMTNWSYNMCKAPVKSSPPTNQHPTLYTGRMPFLLSNPLSKHRGKRLDAEGKSRVQPVDTGSPKKHLLEYCACACEDSVIREIRVMTYMTTKSVALNP